MGAHLALAEGSEEEREREFAGQRRQVSGGEETWSVACSAGECLVI